MCFSLQYNMVCDRGWLVSTAQVAFYVGGTIGSIVAGRIADSWGRKPALFVFLTAMITGSFAAISPPNYLAYIIMRFVVGLSFPAVFNTAFLIGRFVFLLFYQNLPLSTDVLSFQFLPSSCGDGES